MIVSIDTDAAAPADSPYSNYRLVEVGGAATRITKSEVPVVMDWEVEDATLGDELFFTHLERRNSRTGQWKTVVAWDDAHAVRASDAETNHHLATS